MTKGQEEKDWIYFITLHMLKANIMFVKKSKSVYNCSLLWSPSWIYQHARSLTRRPRHLIFHYWGRPHLEPLYSSLPSQFFQSAQNRLLVTFTPIKSRNKVISLRSRRLEVVSKKKKKKNGRAPLACARFLFHPLLPSAWDAGYKVICVLSLALALFYIKLDICFLVLRTFMLRVKRLVFPFSLMP